MKLRAVARRRLQDKRQQGKACQRSKGTASCRGEGRSAAIGLWDYSEREQREPGSGRLCVC